MFSAPSSSSIELTSEQIQESFDATIPASSFPLLLLARLPFPDQQIEENERLKRRLLYKVVHTFYPARHE